MAELGAIHDIGESIAELLKRRRTMLAAEGRLGPVPNSQNIFHMRLGEIAGNAPPTSGLSISCFHVGYSDHNLARRAVRDPSSAHGISLELRYLVASWSSTIEEELAFVSWAMLELNRHPLLDRSLMVHPDRWSREETLQIVPEEASAEELFRIWEALKQRYRLSALFRVRVVRIGYGEGSDALPVVASRFGFADTDPVLEAAAG